MRSIITIVVLLASYYLSFGQPDSINTKFLFKQKGWNNIDIEIADSIVKTITTWEVVGAKLNGRIVKNYPITQFQFSLKSIVITFNDNASYELKAHYILEESEGMVQFDIEPVWGEFDNLPIQFDNLSGMIIDYLQADIIVMRVKYLKRNTLKDKFRETVILRRLD